MREREAERFLEWWNEENSWRESDLERERDGQGWRRKRGMEMEKTEGC